MTDRDSNYLAGNRTVTRLIRPDRRPRAAPTAAASTEGENYDLRRLEAGERRIADQGREPIAERHSPGVTMLAPRAANDDRPTGSGFAAAAEATAAPIENLGYAEIARPSTSVGQSLFRWSPAPAPARPIRPRLPAEAPMDDVGHTIMAMPQIIASHYDRSSTSGRRLPAAAETETIGQRRPAVVLTGLGLIAILTVVGAMHLGGGLDALLSPHESARSVRSASLVGLPSAPAQAVVIAPAPVPAKRGAAAAAIVSDLAATAERTMLDQGARLMDEGDIAGARAVYEVLSRRGSADGTYGYARTYDPAAFLSRKVEGIKPDPQRAIEWYRRAAAVGSLEAQARLMSMQAGQ